MGVTRGSELGRYLVLDELGAGGMGVVLSAYDPQLDRRVALKLVRPELCFGQAAGEARARLQREAQAMARFSHPNVVTVFDVGMMDDQLFVAMEFVDGDLAAWLEDERRHWRDVLRMFVQAGRGLAAAHAVELIHRDFKPANVLVGGDARPRVSDFGLVAALEAESRPEVVLRPAEAQPTADTIALDLTATAGVRVLGTPAYMAPEQFEGAPVDQAADQFAFCVALYEALYATRPFGGRTVDELANNVVSGRLRPPPDSDAPTWIWPVLEQGLGAKPTQRFDSMGELIEALENDPEAAHRRMIALDAMIEFGNARAVAGDYIASEHILANALADASGIGDRNRAAKCHVALALGDLAKGTFDAAASRLAWSRELLDGVEGDREVLGRIHQGEGHLAYRRGDYPGAIEEFRKSIALLEGLPPAMAIETCQVRVSMGEAMRASGDYPGALTQLEGALEQALAERGTMSRYAATALDTLAGTLQELGRFEEASQRFEEALAMRLRLHGEEHPLTADSHIHLGQLRLMTSRFDEAAQLLEKGLAIAERVLGPENPSTRAALNNLGGVHLKRGDTIKAFETLQRALGITEHMFGEDHPEVASTVTNLGQVFHETGEHDRALEYFERAFRVRRDGLGEDHPLTIQSLSNLGANLLVRGEIAKAKETFARVLAGTIRAYGADHPQTAYVHINLSSLHLREEPADHDAAERHLERAHDNVLRAYGPDHDALVTIESNLGDIAYARDDHPSAIEHYRRAIDLNAKLGRKPHITTYASRNLCHALIVGDRHAEAIPYARNAVAYLSTLGPSLLLAILRGQLAAALYDGGGDRVEAETLARSSRAMLVDLGDQGVEYLPFVDRWLEERDLAPSE